MTQILNTLIDSLDSSLGNSLRCGTRSRTSFLIAAVVIACAPAGVSAQDPSKPKTVDAPAKPATSQPTTVPTAKTHPNDPMLWDAEQMMEDAVQQISKRYSLTPQQEDYTRLLLKKRVRDFLDQYDTDVRELLQESIDMRLGRRENDPLSLMKWAVRAAPVYDAAKNAILDGNKEWRQILDEEQIKTHDKDLNLMRANFENVTHTLKDWEEGKGRLPTARSAQGHQDNGSVSTGPAIFRRPEIEDSWIAYVEKFINTYKLDDATRIAAREKIHKDQLEKAKQYRNANREKFRKLEDEKAKIGRDVPVEERMKKIRDIERRRKDLESPIRRLFIDMSRRLESLPSSKQRAAVTEDEKKALADLYRRLAGENDRKVGSEREAADGKPSPSDSPTDKPATTSAPAAPPDANAAKEPPAPKADDKPITPEKKPEEHPAPTTQPAAM